MEAVWAGEKCGERRGVLLVFVLVPCWSRRCGKRVEEGEDAVSRAVHVMLLVGRQC